METLINMETILNEKRTKQEDTTMQFCIQDFLNFARRNGYL